jgi:DNA-binding PadR family transcriptional regulator
MKDHLKQTADKLGEQMKKGFISHLLLLILNNKSSHGYKMIQELNNKTLGMWNPSTSTIYHILDLLEDKELIECIKEQSEGRQKKIYAISQKGKNALDLLNEKYKKMQETMKRMILSSISITGEIDEKKAECFLPHNLHLFNIRETGSLENQLHSLKMKKIIITQRLRQLKGAIRKIDIEIDRLSIKVKNQKNK